jgi:hypothetical protein
LIEEANIWLALFRWNGVSWRIGRHQDKRLCREATTGLVPHFPPPAQLHGSSSEDPRVPADMLKELCFSLTAAAYKDRTKMW